MDAKTAFALIQQSYRADDLAALRSSALTLLALPRVHPNQLAQTAEMAGRAGLFDVADQAWHAHDATGRLSVENVIRRGGSAAIRGDTNEIERCVKLLHEMGGRLTAQFHEAAWRYEPARYFELRYQRDGVRAPVSPKWHGDVAWAERLGADRHLIERLFASLGIRGDASLLEAGCGSGRLTEVLRRLVGRVTSVDVSPTAIEFCRQQTAALEGITYRLADLREKPLEGERFDVVFDGWCVQHIAAPAEWRNTLENYAKLCRGGGYVILIETVLGDSGLKHPLHVTRARVSDYREAFPPHSFTVVAEEFDSASEDATFAFRRDR